MKYRRPDSFAFGDRVVLREDGNQGPRAWRIFVDSEPVAFTFSRDLAWQIAAKVAQSLHRECV